MKVLGLNIRVKRLPKGINSQIKAFRSGMKDLGNGVQGFAREAVRAAGRLAMRPMFLGKSAFEVKYTDDGWMITRQGSSIPLRVFPKKQDAVREARRMGKSLRTEVSIFNREGTLQQHQSYST